jgi:hypothetical protein
MRKDLPLSRETICKGAYLPKWSLVPVISDRYHATYRSREREKTQRKTSKLRK